MAAMIVTNGQTSENGIRRNRRKYWSLKPWKHGIESPKRTEANERTGPQQRTKTRPRNIQRKPRQRQSQRQIVQTLNPKPPNPKQRYIDNTIGISARTRTRIIILLVRNIVWCFSYAVWCISWYIRVLALYSLAAMVWDATTRFLILASRGSCLARGPV